MARIPEDEIERLKRTVSVERLVEARGVKLTRHGADRIGLCPFHNDHSPSLVISPKKNLWNCLGACGTGGSAIDWVMKAEGVSFRHAVELLRADVPMAGAPVKVGTVRKLAAPVERTVDDAGALEQVVAFYHETLEQSPEALAYLEKRGLTHPEMIDRFRLGFANRTLGLRLPAKNRKAGEEIRTRLEKLGVLRESGHEHLNGSLIVPVFGSDGTVMQMYGRKIGGDLRPGTPLHLYLPGPHRGVWNEAALEASKDVILCESLIDALTFWCAGYRNVTASYGVNGFTDDHRAAFRKHGVKRVWIGYDRDEAGNKAASSLAEELIAAGIECFRVLFPQDTDANEYALGNAPADKSLGVLLNAAEWMGKAKTAAKEETPDSPLAAVTAAAEDRQAGPEGTPPIVQGEVRADGVYLTFGDRRYRVRGLEKNASPEITKVNLMASRGEAFHADAVNLQAAQQRSLFAKQAAVELGVKDDVVRHDLGKILLKCEELQDERLRREMEPKPAAPAMTEEERAAALELLRDPRLLDRVVSDLDRCGGSEAVGRGMDGGGANHFPPINAGLRNGLAADGAFASAEGAA